MAYFEEPTRKQMQLMADLAEGGRLLPDVDNEELEVEVVPCMTITWYSRMPRASGALSS